MKSIVIAAPMSGSGKTTVTLGLLSALKRRGLQPAPFKVGPDFIDPGWHSLACGRISVNLDGWMCPEWFVRETFALHARGTGIAVIEGVMGLFDGCDATTDTGSTAQIARIINAPVILVVDAKSQARSAAALVNGFASFDPRVRLAGVIFNNTGSDNHARILREAIASSVSDVKVLGCIPRDSGLTIPSRHLGLVTAGENPLQGEFLDRLAETVEKYLDVEGILSLADRWGQTLTLDKHVQCQGLTPKIAVACDEAFCFVYEDNLRLLRDAGAEIVRFSPLANAGLPAGIDGIYLPGGYPELHAETLAANVTMKTAIREAVEKGMPVYAECGGFIYLTRGLSRGQALTPFVGIFPVSARMLPRRKALGYREVELLDDAVIGRKGAIARGHEFHYSETEHMPNGVTRLYRVRKYGSDIGTEGYRYKNCLGSYIHIHFGSCPELAATFVENCAGYSNG
ncbi:MAG: cobyrinate a,c-diamide synthase [Geobacteraceae bacterium]|nr:cobyrinate a,c-diamide synthase [Geobacteraceae bacterium]